ncbi:CBS domain-containing protein [Oceanobacter mangrovi]|uniref:CBS domain-containing protein n=1 Tax=Oceanobacter mangrovi TaxID=2862510 RepID=UPI001C8F03D7|nr:CBS domain-containing protein [Oceanobacter mangrovi]
MKYVHELMKTEVITHLPSDTLRDAEATMGTHQIRHVPVVDADGKLLGLMSQREFLTEAFRITDKFGAHLLQEYLAKTPIEQCMQQDLVTSGPETLLKEAADIIHDNRRQGCVLVVDEEGYLEGLLTSLDFVKLAARLLPDN